MHLKAYAFFLSVSVAMTLTGSIGAQEPFPAPRDGLERQSLELQVLLQRPQEVRSNKADVPVQILTPVVANTQSSFLSEAQVKKLVTDNLDAIEAQEKAAAEAAKAKADAEGYKIGTNLSNLLFGWRLIPGGCLCRFQMLVGVNRIEQNSSQFMQCLSTTHGSDGLPILVG